MDLGIAGTTALLMSSTRGLGFGCAEALAVEGVQVVINGRNREHGMEVVSGLGGNAHFIQADISLPAERERLFKEALDILGRISILVINIDGPMPGTFMSKNIEDWRSACELIMVSALDMVKRCIPGMIEQNYGRIINISSTSAKDIIPGPVMSNSFKPGLIGALGTLAREVAEDGITVNSILPGPFDTDMMRKAALKAAERQDISLEEEMKIFTGKVPMKRMGTIREFGALCAFLCSRQAGFITGQSIVIDGGLVPILF